jgi:hypothetical protein
MVSGFTGGEAWARMAGWPDRKMKKTAAAAREIGFFTMNTPGTRNKVEWNRKVYT